MSTSTQTMKSVQKNRDTQQTAPKTISKEVQCVSWEVPTESKSIIHGSSQNILPKRSFGLKYLRNNMALIDKSNSVVTGTLQNSSILTDNSSKMLEKSTPGLIFGAYGNDLAVQLKQVA